MADQNGIQVPPKRPQAVYELISGEHFVGNGKGTLYVRKETDAYMDHLEAERDAARSALEEAKRKLKYAEVGAMCPVCVGEPISSKPCICGGSNDAHDAYSGCLRDLLKAEAENRRLLLNSKKAASDLATLAKAANALIDYMRSMLPDTSMDYAISLLQLAVPSEPLKTDKDSQCATEENP